MNLSQGVGPSGQRGGALTKMIVPLVIVGMIAFGAFNCHVIKTTEAIRFIPKSSPGFEDIYVDVSRWDVVDLFANPTLVRDITHAGYGSEIPQVKAFNHAVDAGVDSVQEFDRRYGVSDAATMTISEMERVDQKYGISDKAAAAGDAAVEATKSAAEAAKDWWDSVDDG